MNTLAKEVEEKDDKLETMKRTMSDAKDALMAFFGVHFISHGNKSVEYAFLDMGKKVVEWNFGLCSVSVSIRTGVFLGFPFSKSSQTGSVLKPF